MDRRGFSLIEVIIALGVLSFSALAVMGLLSVASGISRQTISTALAQRVSMEIIGNLIQTGRITENGSLYFDIEGKSVDADKRVFEAWQTVLGCGIPGSSAEPIKRVVVQVFHNPGKVSLQRGASGLVQAPHAQMEVSTFQFHAPP